MDLLGGILQKSTVWHRSQAVFRLISQDIEEKMVILGLDSWFWWPKEFESPMVEPSINNVEGFLAGLRFEKRDFPAEFPGEPLVGQMS